MKKESAFGVKELKIGYGDAYKRPISLGDQIDILRMEWPGLNPDKALKYVRGIDPKVFTYGWCEGPFAIVRPGYFSNHYKIEVREVFKALENNIRFETPKFLTKKPQHPILVTRRTSTFLEKISEEQEGDILVVPAQLGIANKGVSVKELAFRTGEFGVDIYMAGQMLLTNRDRLSDPIHLWVGCPGNLIEYQDLPNQVPCFMYANRGIEYGHVVVEDENEFFGAATAFRI